METPLRRAASIAPLLLMALACGADAPPDEVQRIDRARFGIVDVATPPPDSDLRESLSLPDHWNQRRPEAAGIGWYRMTVDLPVDADEPWGLYVPSSSSSFEVFVAGEHLGPTRLGDEPNLQSWNRPEYFELPSALMQRARQTIDLRLWAREGNYRGLGPLEVGPARLLQPRFRSARFWQFETHRLWLVLGVTLTLFGAGLWAATGKNSMYGFFVWLAAAWIAPVAVQSMTRFPGSFWLGQWLVHVGFSQMAIAGVFLAHRIVGVTRPRLERGLLIGGAVAATSLAFAAGFLPEWFDPLAIAFHVVALGVCMYLPALFARKRASLKPIERFPLIAGLLSLLGISAHDLAAQLAWLPGDTSRLLPYALPIILLMFFSVLFSRFLQLYRRAERQNVELEARIREKLRELEDRYAQLDHLRRAGVLADERARMTREMHDGMGAQLVSLLSLAESDSADRNVLATGIRESIDELRFVIHSLEPTGSEVGTLLALLRERYGPRIDHSGLRVQWAVGTSGDEVELSPERALHLVRIVQEAVTNVLKHAHASAVEIATEAETRDGVPGVIVRISDDGVGIDEVRDSAAPVGRGLENMKQRGRALGGSLRISGGEGGTTVELWLPDDGQ
jgi:signal transduction histidine kinase